MLSADTSDCPIEEVLDNPELSQNPALCSFKQNGAGLRHEVGIDVFHSQMIWMNGPILLPGNTNDNKIFANDE